MNSFNMQLQLIKSQIENMRTVITNIEMQNNIMNASFQGEQLKDLGIQMFNTGLNTFNLGKSLSVSLFDNYIIQLKNISEQISFIINTYNTSNQQMQMMMEQQNQFMQAQIMNQNINNIQENIEIKKMNIMFVIKNGHDPVIPIIYNFGTKTKDALEIFSNKIGKNKNQLNFRYNGRYINYDDERKVEEVFGGGVPRIYVFEK